MMYSNKLVATLKHNGKVLREQGDTVYLPFGSEYSIFIKNLNTVKAIATIEVDGQSIGADIVIDPNKEIDIERFVGNLTQGNRFKFIERTASVEQHRGIGTTDGIIRIEFQFEKPYTPPVYTPRPDPWHNTTPWGYNNTTISTMNVNGVLRSVDLSNGEATKATATAAINSYLVDNGIGTGTEHHSGSATMDWAPANDVGITVPGSVSDQKFHYASRFATDGVKHAIVLQLKGETQYNKVTEPVTVKTKPKCVTCGKVNKTTSKFCTNCGTSLTIV